MSLKSEILIVYHANCVDGFTAAWCAYQKWGDKAEYAPFNNLGEKLEVDGRDVTFLDCCPKREQLLSFKARAKSLTVLDHHITNQKDCGDIEGCRFDLSKSGAMIAAEEYGIVTPRNTVPLLVQYVQDQDLWKMEMPSTREIRASIMAEPFSFENWKVLCEEVENSRETKIIEGKAIIKSSQKEMDYLKAKIIPMRFCGYDQVPVVNMAHGDISSMLNEMAKTSPAGFAVAWHQAKEGVFKYSLRSCNSFDCAELASKEFGAGGHPKAAGFSAPGAPWNYPERPSAFRQETPIGVK